MNINRSLSIGDFVEFSEDQFLVAAPSVRRVVENLETVKVRDGCEASISLEGGGGVVCSLQRFLGYINTTFLIQPDGIVRVEDGGGSDFALYYFYQLLSGREGLTDETIFGKDELEIRDIIISLFHLAKKDSLLTSPIHLCEVGLVAKSEQKRSLSFRGQGIQARHLNQNSFSRFVDKEQLFLTWNELQRGILNHFYFKFSNDQQISLADIFFSPYSLLLPEQLVPKLGEIKGELTTGLFSWADHCAGGELLAEYSMDHLELLSFFISRSRSLLGSGQIQFSLSRGSGDRAEKQDVRTLEMTSVDIDWSLEMSRVDVFLKGQMSPVEASIAKRGGGSSFESSTGSLTFYNLHSELDRAKAVGMGCGQYYFGDRNIEFNKKSVIFMLPSGTPLQQIKHQLKKHRLSYSNNVEEVSYGGGDRLVASFTSGDNTTVEVSVIYDGDGLQRSLVGQIGWLGDVVDGLNFGLAGFFGETAPRLATKDSLKRHDELKLYKHSGLFLLLLLECLKYLRSSPDQGSVTNKKSFKAFSSGLLSRLEEFAVDLLSKGGRRGVCSFSDLVSNKFVSRLKKVIKLICDKESMVESYYAEGKCWHVHYENSLLNLVELISEIPLNVYAGKAFSRASFKCYDISIKNAYGSDRYRNEDEDFDDDDDGPLVIHAPKGLNFKSFSKRAECLIDGQSIETLVGSDLVAEFHMRERDGLQQGSSAEWFDLHPKVFFKGEEVSAETADRFLKDPVVFHQGKYYFLPENQVPALKWLDYFWERLHSGKSGVRVADVSKKDSKAIGGIKSDVLNMLALRSAGVPVIGGPRWESICKEFDQLKDLTPVGLEKKKQSLQKVLKSFNADLKPFQLEGVLWLEQIYRLGLGGILSDEMGLGKTVQSLAFLEALRANAELGQNLIVVPTSLVYNWSTEIKRFCPHFDVEVLESRKIQALGEKLKQDSDRLVICTYGLLNENRSFFEQHEWNVVFFDEAQSIKNVKAKRREAAVVVRAKSKICLTGTPMENHYGEFFSMVDLVVPGALGTYAEFMKTYKLRGDTPVTVDDLEFLKKKVRPLVLRRSKQQVLSELPDKAESVVLLEFDEQQESIYRDIAISWNSKIRNIIEVKGESKSQLEMLTALMRLRQACSCPRAIPNISYSQPTPKENLLIENVKELIENQESVIVFTNFVTSLDLLKERFEAEGLPFLSLCGKDSLKSREKTLRTFSESDKPYILAMTLKTGGVGLNLTKASYVIHFEPWWNPAAENQGTDRVHRIGQKRSVQVYRYIMKDSVEEKIQDLKQLKSKAFEALFAEHEAEYESETEKEMAGNAKLSKSSLSQKDFEVLLS